MDRFTKELYHIRGRPGVGDRWLFRLCTGFAIGWRSGFTNAFQETNSDGFSR
jgi:hypothetical protein